MLLLTDLQLEQVIGGASAVEYGFNGLTVAIVMAPQGLATAFDHLP